LHYAEILGRQAFIATAEHMIEGQSSLLVVVGVSKTTFPILTTNFPFPVLSAHHATATEAAGKHNTHIPSHG
jgi:hypothetical protein